MPKILMIECKQEVSTFNPALSHYQDFVVTAGAVMFEAHKGTHTEVAGAMDVFKNEPDVELIAAYSARAITSGGVLAQQDFIRLTNELLEKVQEHRDVSAVYFCLHGAMAASDEDDPEGYLLGQIRKILGDELPIVASLDLHGILTDRMLEHTDAVVPYHTYPHVDFYETGVRAARLLLRILRHEVHPVTAKVFIPALVRGDELITAGGLFGDFIRTAQHLETTPPGLSAGMFIGNPFTDVPALGSNSLVVTDSDAERAKVEAIALAERFWSNRDRLQAHLVSLDEAIEITDTTVGTVILTDAADAPSSGAPGDSNAILRALAERQSLRTVLAPIVDAPAVKAAFQAGVGNSIRTAVGGTVDPSRFTPLPIEAHVHLLADGIFRNESDGGTWYAGPTAVLKTHTVTLVITSRPVSLYDRSLFLSHGQNPGDYDIVIVKSPHCQPHFYAAWATRVLNVDAPGATSANLRTLGHTRCKRPIFPLDHHVPFTPNVKLFRRKS